MIKYSTDIEAEMKKVYNTLSEKDRRRYASVEAIKLGYGGQSYISKLLGCSIKTIQRGIKDFTKRWRVSRAYKAFRWWTKTSS